LFCQSLKNFVKFMTIKGIALAIVVGAITLTALPASGNSSESGCKSMFSYVETKNFAIEQCADRKNAYISVGNSSLCPVTIIPKKGRPIKLTTPWGKECGDGGYLGSKGNTTYSLTWRAIPNSAYDGGEPVRFIIKRRGKTIINEAVINYSGWGYLP
jgi:hypothetical protein